MPYDLFAFEHVFFDLCVCSTHCVRMYLYYQCYFLHFHDDTVFIRMIGLTIDTIYIDSVSDFCYANEVLCSKSEKIYTKNFGVSFEIRLKTVLPRISCSAVRYDTGYAKRNTEEISWMKQTKSIQSGVFA